jgi:hypothetical protein
MSVHIWPRFVQLSSVGAAGALLFVAVGGANTAYADEVAQITEQVSEQTQQPPSPQLLQVAQTAVAVQAAQGDALVSADTPVPVAVSTTDADTSGAAATAGATPAPAVVANPTGAQAVAWEQVQARGWGADQFACLVSLWNKESGWRVNAANASSGAYGIPQALPGSKMASAGADWQTNAATQITWGLGYIAGRYSTPCGAWTHSQLTGWY